MNIKSKICAVKTTRTQKETSAGYVYLNFFNRDFHAELANRKWVTNLYELTIRQEMETRGLKDLKQVVLHSDQGSVYSSVRYHQLADKHGFIPTMSKKANC